MKAQIEEEIKDTTFLDKLNSNLEDIVSFTLPYEESIRNLVIIKKLKETNNIYPRKYDKITKNPL